MTPEKRPSPDAAARQIAKTYFGVGDDAASNRYAVRRLLFGALEVAALIPALFFLRFGEVGGLGWGMTIFFVAYCLLAAIGLQFRSKARYHTPIVARGDWVDWIGAFWLVSCAFGPLFGWIATSAIPLTESDWRWLYMLRVVLAAGVPLLTAVPLTRYLRGKATHLALPILVVVTMLPIWSVVGVSKDLWEGPIVTEVQGSSQPVLYLPHTDRRLERTR